MTPGRGNHGPQNNCRMLSQPNEQVKNMPVPFIFRCARSRRRSRINADCGSRVRPDRSRTSKSENMPVGAVDFYISCPFYTCFDILLYLLIVALKQTSNAPKTNCKRRRMMSLPVESMIDRSEMMIHASTAECNGVPRGVCRKRGVTL